MSDVKPVAWLISGVDARNGNPWRTASLHNAAADYRACEDLRDVTVGLLYSQETIDALQAEIEALRKDAERFAWVLPIIDGECDKFADARTAALAGQFLNGKSGRDAIDAAIAKWKQL